MPSGLHRARNLSDVSGTVAWRGEKMKDCAIMPHVIYTGFQLDFSDVGNEPTHALRGLSKTFPARFDSGLRNVQDTYVLVAAGDKVIDECGFTTTDIDNR